MNDIECYFYCVRDIGLLYPLMVLLSLIFLFVIIYIIKRNYESLLTSQFILTITISLNLLSMNCHMLDWFWIYIGIILVGTILLVLAKMFLDLKLDEKTLELPPYLHDIARSLDANINIYDTDRIKAFAYKNNIYLSIGLIERLEKDEIKSVVAHEVYHLRNSPNKFLSSLLAITSLTFRRFRDEHRADRFAVRTTGVINLVNALNKLQIKDAERRINRL